MQSTHESWKPVVGYEGTYEVSDHGNVRSVDREVRHWRGGMLRKPGRPMSQWTDAWGYRKTKLSCEGISRACFVHILVAEAFIGPKLDGMQVCHCDSDPSNNRVANLRYDSPTGNAADTVSVGHTQRGVKNRTNKLTEDQVREIRARHSRGGVTLAALGEEYNVVHTAISKIVNRVNWAWLD